jgi:hypothetical protein
VRDDRKQDIEYFWEFGNTHGSYLADEMNIPDPWKDANTAKGWHVAHSYNDEGSYNWSVMAYEPASGRYGFASGTVVATNQDAFYPRARTVVYAPNGTAGLTIPLAAIVVSTWEQWVTAYQAQGATDYTRLLIAPGLHVLNEGFTVDRHAGLGLVIAALDPTDPDKPVWECNSAEVIG